MYHSIQGSTLRNMAKHADYRAKVFNPNYKRFSLRRMFERGDRRI